MVKSIVLMVLVILIVLSGTAYYLSRKNAESYSILIPSPIRSNEIEIHGNVFTAMDEDHVGIHISRTYDKITICGNQIDEKKITADVFEMEKQTKPDIPRYRKMVSESDLDPEFKRIFVTLCEYIEQLETIINERRHK